MEPITSGRGYQTNTAKKLHMPADEALQSAQGVRRSLCHQTGCETKQVFQRGQRSMSRRSGLMTSKPASNELLSKQSALERPLP